MPRLLNSLIENCWKTDPEDRPTIREVVVILRELQKWVTKPSGLFSLFM